MASKKDWESCKSFIEDLTDCGVEKQSWGKRSNVKDQHERSQQARQNEEKFAGDIAVFSSSDDDDDDESSAVVGFVSASTIAAKRALTARKTTSNKPKRHKKCDNDYNSPYKQTTYADQSCSTPGPICSIPGPFGTTSTSSKTVASSRTPNPSRIPAPSRTPASRRTPAPSTTLASSRNSASSRTPVPSRTPASTKTSTHETSTIPAGPCTSTYNSNKRSNLEVRKWKLFPNRFESSFTYESPSVSHCSSVQEHLKDEITWSDSDSEDKDLNDVESSPSSPEDKIPLSTQNIKQQQESQDSGNINEYESDSESFTKYLDVKENSPSIRPNTPTPTPTPCTPPKKGEACPPLDSTKKRKRKYLRNGLAERLQKLTMQENCNRSFWRHKTQQRNDDSDSSSSSAEVTVTVRVMSENLDHGVYVLKCHVLAQDMEPSLPKYVIILLESDRRKHLDINITSSCLRIYSPWKILNLHGSSEPVLLCMAHCETIPSLDLIFENTSDLSDNEQTQSEVVNSTILKQNISEISWNAGWENEKDQDGKKKRGSGDCGRLGFLGI